MEYMWVRKEIGQSGVAGYWWERDGDVVRVSWDLGVELVHLKGSGFTQVEAPADQEDFDPGLPGDVPDGTAVDVLDWVGTDKGRAAAALKAEKGKGSDARISLISKLEKLAA